MWVICSDGAFDAAAHRNRKHYRTVRVRDRADLERLLDRLHAAVKARLSPQITYLQKWDAVADDWREDEETFTLAGSIMWKPEIRDTPKRDYPHRLMIPDAGWQLYLMFVAEAIDYYELKEDMNTRLHEDIDLPLESVTSKLQGLARISRTLKEYWSVTVQEE
jgi:hypothetical protein